MIKYHFSPEISPYICVVIFQELKDLSENKCETLFLSVLVRDKWMKTQKSFMFNPDIYILSKAEFYSKT